MILTNKFCAFWLGGVFWRRISPRFICRGLVAEGVRRPSEARLGHDLVGPSFSTARTSLAPALAPLVPAMGRDAGVA